jgi:hypothetical protein
MLQAPAAAHLIAGLLREEQRMGTERRQCLGQRLGGGRAVFLVLAVVVVVVGTHSSSSFMAGWAG